MDITFNISNKYMELTVQNTIKDSSSSLKSPVKHLTKIWVYLFYKPESFMCDFDFFPLSFLSLFFTSFSSSESESSFLFDLRLCLEIATSSSSLLTYTKKYLISLVI